MPDDLKGVFAGGLDVVAGEFRQDVIDEAKDLVPALTELLDGGRQDPNTAADLITAFARAALKKPIMRSPVF